MHSRRGFLLGGTAAVTLPLSGCDTLPAVFSPSPKGAVDIHNHIFNGRDVPATGFIRQVVLRDADAPVTSGDLLESLIKLLALIMLSGTPTSEQELENLQQPQPRTREDVLAQDERNTARGIARFQREIGAETSGFRTAARDDQSILGQIEAELGITSGPTRSLRLRADYSTTLAREIYRESSGVQDRSARSFQSNSRLLSTIRWAGLLTRSRNDIFGELKRLFGNEGQIRIFSPSLVDFQRWLRPRDTVSSVRSQIDVTSRIAQLQKEDLILPFAPFCPLRAALEAEDSGDPNFDTLALLKYAVARGFAGVKLYPPMGFLPIGNADLPNRPFVRRWPRGGGRALDDQLLKLYDWCVAEGVPIKAHANNSLAAQPCSSLYASPTNWVPVVSQPRYRQLRLNLAHFGGFDETLDPPKRCRDPQGRDWEEILAGMLGQFPNLYFDIGYWSELLSPGSEGYENVVNKTIALFQSQPLIAERMMYGSDWLMLGREPAHNTYKRRVEDALARMFPDPGQRDAVLGENALRYLDLRRGTQQWARLSAFFGDNQVFAGLLRGG